MEEAASEAMDIEGEIDILPWDEAIYAIGMDDKTGISIAQDTPTSATAHESGQVLVREGDTNQAADHNWGCDKLTPSVRLQMNIGKDPAESLFSGGPQGNGKISVALHDAVFESSDFFTHNASALLDMERHARDS